jgi:hypothetical protein
MTHIANAAGVFFPATKQSIPADIDEIRRELALAAADLSIDDPVEGAILDQLFAADDQLRKISRATDRVAQQLSIAGALERKKNRAPVAN